MNPEPRNVLVFLRRVGDVNMHPITRRIIYSGIHFDGDKLDYICVEFDRDLIFSEPFYSECKRVLDEWLNSSLDFRGEFRDLVFKLQNIARSTCGRSAKGKPRDMGRSQKGGVQMSACTTSS